MNPGKQEAQVVSELSFGNLFIRSERFLPLGSAVQVVVHLPSAPEPFALEGRVARVVDDEDARARKAAGMALDVGLDDEARARLAVLRMKLQMPPVAFLNPAGRNPGDEAARLFEDLRQLGTSQEIAPGAAQFEATQPGLFAIAPAPGPVPAEPPSQLVARVAELEAALAERDAERARHEETTKKLYVELATLRASARPTNAARHGPPSRRPAVLAGMGGLLAGAAVVMALVVLVRPDLTQLPAMPWHPVAQVTAPATGSAQTAAPLEPPAPADSPDAPEADAVEEGMAATPAPTPEPAKVEEPKVAPTRPSKVKVAPARGPLSPEAGTLELRADQPATAFVNGRRAGPTPLRMQVNPGRVSVRFDCEVEHVTVHGTGRSVRVPPKGTVSVDYACTK